MVAPSIGLIALVALWPIAYAIWLSLHEYSLVQAGLSRWAEPFGLGNYIDALESREFWRATRITVIFTIASVFLETIIGLAMALIMHSAFKGQGLLRTVVLVPWAVLTVVTAIMWRSIFDPNLGFVNTLLGSNTVWLGEEPQALMVMIFADVWKTAPFMALLLLAGLQVIPSDVYEAAKIDGATALQRFRRITLPLLMPALLVALIFRTLDALRAFDLPKVLTNGANGTETLSLIAARTFQENRLYGEGSTLSVLTFLIVMAVSFGYIRLVGGNLKAMAGD
ncbi:MAG: sugar ABC transporter permease [Chloroflexota bacterium]|nr:sugar ABC transporter permease [Chloroflexota bacterium]